MKKLSLAVLGLVACSFISLGSQAATPVGATTSADGLLTTRTQAPVQAHKPAAPRDNAGLSAIYSNYNGDESNLYDAGVGWTISGPASPVGATYAVAMPFTPAADGKVKKISMAVGYVTGTNGVSVSLNADGGGIPGAVIKKFKVSGLPNFGGCCDTSTVALTKAVPVKAGTTYWVVVMTSKKTADTWAAWNWNNVGADGPFAFLSGGVWNATSGTVGAFEVLGR